MFPHVDFKIFYFTIQFTTVLSAIYPCNYNENIINKLQYVEDTSVTFTANNYIKN